MNLDQLQRGRVQVRGELLDRVVAELKDRGAVYIQLFGSLASGNPDWLSDVDVLAAWPNEEIHGAVDGRENLYHSLGDVLVFHEMPRNRPVGGAYAHVLYASSFGPNDLDIYLAPLGSARRVEGTRELYRAPSVAIAPGGWLWDSSAPHVRSHREQVDWLICLTDVAAKVLIRGRDPQFLGMLVQRYAEAGEEFFGGMPHFQPPLDLYDLLPMLAALQPFADRRQQPAIAEVAAYLERCAGLLANSSRT
ncbi:MAG: nucleotidyltransferase domain-containing protein [Chloroflexota bacterium]